MLITVRRFTSNDDATLSAIFINDEFECFGLEDEYRKDKVSGETRIPAGTYKVGVRTGGGFHARYKTRFDFHQGMLHVLNVPGFKWILIHVGNTDEDTAGCLLVGRGATSGDDMSVQSSVSAYRDFYNKVIDSAKAGDLTIEYLDEDR